MGAFWSASALECNDADKSQWELNWRFTIYVLLFVTVVQRLAFHVAIARNVKQRKHFVARVVCGAAVLSQIAVASAMYYVIGFCPSSCICDVASYSYSLMSYPAIFFIVFLAHVVFGSRLDPKGKLVVAFSAARPASVQLVAPIIGEQAGSSLLANQHISTPMPTASSTADAAPAGLALTVPLAASERAAEWYRLNDAALATGAAAAISCTTVVGAPVVASGTTSTTELQKPTEV